MDRSKRVHRSLSPQDRRYRLYLLAPIRIVPYFHDISRQQRGRNRGQNSLPGAGVALGVHPVPGSRPVSSACRRRSSSRYYYFFFSPGRPFSLRSRHDPERHGFLTEHRKIRRILPAVRSAATAPLRSAKN